jgi:hypothetical protein
MLLFFGGDYFSPHPHNDITLTMYIRILRKRKIASIERENK